MTSDVVYDDGILRIARINLQFCDAAALHAMIAPAGDGSRQVVLHRPAAALQALIRIVGWDDLRGLKVVSQ